MDLNTRRAIDKQLAAAGFVDVPAMLPPVETIPEPERMATFKRFSYAKSISKLFAACKNEGCQGWKEYAIAEVKRRMKCKPKMYRKNK